MYRPARDDERPGAQQPARPRAEPEPQFVRFGLVTTGDPLILGTCGREAAFGLLGLTAPGIPGWFAAGLPVVPGGLVWATAEVATARPSPTDNIASRSIHICQRSNMKELMLFADGHSLVQILGRFCDIFVSRDAINLKQEAGLADTSHLKCIFCNRTSPPLVPSVALTASRWKPGTHVPTGKSFLFPREFA